MASHSSTENTLIFMFTLCLKPVIVTNILSLTETSLNAQTVSLFRGTIMFLFPIVSYLLSVYHSSSFALFLQSPAPSSSLPPSLWCHSSLAPGGEGERDVGKDGWREGWRTGGGVTIICSSVHTIRVKPYTLSKSIIDDTSLMLHILMLSWKTWRFLFFHLK